MKHIVITGCFVNTKWIAVLIRKSYPSAKKVSLFQIWIRIPGSPKPAAPFNHTIFICPWLDSGGIRPSFTVTFKLDTSTTTNVFYLEQVFSWFHIFGLYILKLIFLKFKHFQFEELVKQNSDTVTDFGLEECSPSHLLTDRLLSPILKS